MNKCLDSEIGYSCKDVLDLVKTYLPKGENRKEASFSQSFYLGSLIVELLSLNNEESKEQIKHILNIHNAYLRTLSNINDTCILSLNKEIYEVENIHIRTKLEMFARLAAYTKNPLEPIIKLLIKPTKYKNRVSDLITSICRGDHISVKMELYELEDTILKED